MLSLNIKNYFNGYSNPLNEKNPIYNTYSVLNYINDFYIAVCKIEFQDID